ncbi:chemotaxis protein CheA [Pseudobutyrivibrio sp. MD2005]|uniref:chemotaxis protein CheA n=1 Tax=Pseudobutyrivibrio sp. MD2005 TaxID=1410616 RepID=UPI000484CE60|nr:chemotaxis protein CheA [Pseudobutyrivibrio sp. MD2005]
MDVSQYLDIFIDETSGHIQSLSDNIMELEKEPDNKDVVNEIFRSAHSLKGMAGTMGFKRMQHLTHDMENVFQEVRNDNVKVNSSLIDILFKCLDAIEAYLDTVKATSNEGTEENEALIKLLNDYLTQAEGGEAPAEGAPAADAAPAEGAPAADDSADGPLFKKMKLEPELIEKLKGEKQLYGFTIHINKECLLKAARAFLVFKAVEEFGQIMAFDPSSSDIEDEKFDFDFSFILSTESEVDPILESVKAVSEIESVEYEIVTPDIYEKKEAEPEPEPAPAPAEAAAPAAPAPAAPAPAPAAKPAAPAAKSSGGKNQPANKPVTSRTIRVDIEKLDALMNQVSELIIAKNSLASQSSASGEIDGQTLHENIEYLERITTNLHESVMKVRMVPIESVVAKFPRMIRDLDRKLNKPMELVMTGEDTELDRTVVDQLGDPLQHLLRNSADHGIESPEDRRAAGKPEKGTIFLNAFQEGNNVIIEVGDDGGGINTDKVRDKAVERGLVTPEEAENLSQKEIIDFLFMPSFSMAKQITDISGRGVGLDVVKSNIEALGGDVTVKSTMGEGSTFTVRLPLTLAIIQALMVEIRDEKYAIALASIMNIENIPVSEIKYVESKEVIHLRGQVIPLIHLDKILDFEPKESTEDTMTVVICKKGDTLGGIIVDNLIGQLEIVIKSLGKLDNNKLISGATILGDGEIAMILDVNAVI